MSRHLRVPSGLPVAVLAATIGLAACANRGSVADVPACMPIDGPASFETAALDALAGEYELVLVAASGERAGATAQGTLDLHAYAGRLRLFEPRSFTARDVVLPYFGATDIDLEAVGAVRVGTGMSLDSLAPGVLFVQQNERANEVPTSITLRIGSEANGRLENRFDGGYMALRVRRLAGASMAGTWASGISAEQSAGHFCLVPAPAP